MNRITRGALWDRDAAEVVSGHAADVADLAGLLAMLGIASAPPRPPGPRRRDRGRPWPRPVREPARVPAVVCVVGACRNPVTTTGAICAGCVITLGPYLRKADRAIGRAA
jgi:hypothetical protein